MNASLFAKMRTLIYFVLFILLLPIFIIIFLLFWFYKQIVDIIVKSVYSSVSPFTLHDKSVILHSNNFYASSASEEDTEAQQQQQKQPLISNIGGILFLEDNPSLQEIRQLFISKVLKLPQCERLNKIPLKFMGHFYWIQPRILRLQQSFIERAVHGSLEDFISKWMHQPYFQGHPLWQICLCKFNNNENTALLFKMNHCMGDGYAVEQILALFLQADYPQINNNDNNKNELKFYEKLWRNIQFLIQAPKLIVDQLQAFTSSDYFAQTQKLGSCSTSFKKVPLEIVKELRHKYNCRFNDILLAALGNALNEWLKFNKLQSSVDYASVMVSRSLPRSVNDPVGNEG